MFGIEIRSEEMAFHLHRPGPVPGLFFVWTSLRLRRLYQRIMLRRALLECRAPAVPVFVHVPHP